MVFFVDTYMYKLLHVDLYLYFIFGYLIFACVSILNMLNNTAPHYYAYAKKAFVHSSKLHVSKNSNVLYDRPFLKEIRTTLFMNEYFLSGDQIFTFKN